MIRDAIGELRLYGRLVGISVRAQAQYRLTLLIDIVSYFFVTALEFLSILVIFGRFPTLLGWSLGEVALLFAMTSLSFGLSELIGAGIDNFPDSIRRGDFDRVLLRPATTLTQIAGGDFRLRRLGRLTEGALLFLFALGKLPHFHWTLAKVIALPLGLFSGALMFVAVLLLGATLCFWTVETTELTNILTYGGREMLSYPLTIFHPALRRFFLFVVPLAFGTFVPTCYLLSRALPFGLPSFAAFIAPLVACLCLLLACVAWRFGVRRYQSVGN
ncbi:MAG TPA: ABC-2 family transporter protein [Ktedonobacterales bacterium]